MPLHGLPPVSLPAGPKSSPEGLGRPNGPPAPWAAKKGELSRRFLAQIGREQMDPLAFSLIVLAALVGWEPVVRPLLVDED